jgi:hypothetical protein
MGLHEDCYPLTKEAYLKFKTEIEAWANGEQIQFRIKEGPWHDIKEGKDPNWITSVEYRVKPKK